MRVLNITVYSYSYNSTVFGTVFNGKELIKQVVEVSQTLVSKEETFKNDNTSLLPVLESFTIE